MLMMWDRWKKLEKAFYNSEADTFDISKIPDIYDSIKFDCIHNSHLRCDYSKVRFNNVVLCTCMYALRLLKVQALWPCGQKGA